MTGEPLGILVTSAGRRVGLLLCFRQAAEDLGLSVQLHACDLVPQLSAACAMADHRFEVPRCTDPGYVDALYDYCVAHGIRLLVPTIDTELMALSRAVDRFAAAGCRIHVGRPI